LSDNVGKVYLCISCNSFKGFIVSKNSKVNNLFANGHSKIIVDDETLKCYCGRRSEKSETKQRSRTDVETFLSVKGRTELSKRQMKKEWKMAKKSIQNQRCANTECLQINLTGVILQFYDQLYLFCPFCANPTVFNGEQHDKNGFTCSQCCKGGTRFTNVSCSICGLFKGKNTWETVTCVYANKQTETIAVCNCCFQEKGINKYEGSVPYQLVEEQRNKIINQRKKQKM
jgi:hypothetical protein